MKTWRPHRKALVTRDHSGSFTRLARRSERLCGRIARRVAPLEDERCRRFRIRFPAGSTRCRTCSSSKIWRGCFAARRRRFGDACGLACSRFPCCRAWTSAGGSAAPTLRRGLAGAAPAPTDSLVFGAFHVLRVLSRRVSSRPVRRDRACTPRAGCAGVCGLAVFGFVSELLR